MLPKILMPVWALTAGMLFVVTVQEPPAEKNSARKSVVEKSVARKSVAEEAGVTVRKESPDREAIRLVEDAFAKAYESGDAKAVAAFFTEDAEYVDETGAVFEGREAIESCLTAFFEENLGCKLKISPDSIRTISPGVVVQDGSTLATRSDGTAPVESRYTTIYVKQNGKWLVASVRDSVPRGLREHATQLQQLSWLSGDWVDEGDDCIISFSCKPVDNGNFLLRTFSVVVAGQEAMNGTQRIGWDPLTGKLRAWIFDSEGAYAEGLWHQDPENNRWILKTTGVTADGETASSTSLYTFVNEHTMTWQSVDHEIAGIQQPDSEVITIVRHSPPPAPAVAVDAKQK